MYFYHGYALGVASTIPGNIFTKADCALSIRGGESAVSEPATTLPPGITFNSADSKIRGWGDLRKGLPVWYIEASVVIKKLDVLGKFTAESIEAHIFFETRAGDYESSIVIADSKFVGVKVAGNELNIEISNDLTVRYPTYSSMQTAFQNRFSQPGVLAMVEGRGLDAQTANTPDLRAAWEAYGEQKALGEQCLPSLKPAVICSFVTKVSGGGYQTWGPIVAVPNFGNIYLGEVIVWPWMRCLNMFRIELASGGTISGGSAGTSGTSIPPGGHPLSDGT
jgi:hypothetical protein